MSWRGRLPFCVVAGSRLKSLRRREFVVAFVKRKRHRV